MSLNSSESNGQKNVILSNNPSFTFAHAKAERLSTAVHMVTRYMGEQEPLRLSLRSESIKLLSRIFILEEGVGDSIPGIIARIVSLLDIAYRTQYISEMNWDVIRTEYIAFDSFFEERNLGAIPDSKTIPKNFFDIEIPESLSSATGIAGTQAKTRIVIKDKIIPKGQEVKTKSRTTKSPIIKERKNGRKEVILKLLKERKKLTVRDVAEVISNVSEKTLQRELISLVNSGTLRREGERRWSTYFLA